MVCAPVREDNPQALASELSNIQTHKPYNSFLIDQHEIFYVKHWKITKPSTHDETFVCNSVLQTKVSSCVHLRNIFQEIFGVS